MALSNYGEAFARNVLRKFYANAITPVIANTDYEGDIKKIGSKVNVLMFLEDVTLSDYSVGTDMSTQHPVDTEAQLEITQQKYYNFDIDVVDKQFTYVDDEDSALIENAANILEKAVDQRLLSYYIEDVRAGNRVPKKETDGQWTFVVGNTGTYVTITTAASYGIATLTGGINENSGDECDFFPVNCVGRGIRICSNTYNSPWYRITTRSSSTVINFNNWDGSLIGDNNNSSGKEYVKDLFGADKYKPSGTAGWGVEIEGMKSTLVTTSNIYALICDLATALDDDDVPATDRHLSVPPWFYNILVQASAVNPAIATAYEEVLKNRKVARVAGFDVHMVSDDRFSTCTDPIGSWVSSNTGYKLLANHTSFITFAHKWAESRVIDAQLQFAKLYQGLNLYGFKVLNLRRKAGAYLYCRH